MPLQPAMEAFLSTQGEIPQELRELLEAMNVDSVKMIAKMAPNDDVLRTIVLVALNFPGDAEAACCGRVRANS